MKHVAINNKQTSAKKHDSYLFQSKQIFAYSMYNKTFSFIFLSLKHVKYLKIECFAVQYCF